MAETVTNFLIGHGIQPVLVVFIISMLPLLELRGGIFAAMLLGIPWYIALPVCFAGTVIPVPFILLFIRQIFKWLKKIKPLEKLITKIEVRTARKSMSMKRKSLLGVFIFVAVPIPGTGAWTGSLIADILDLRIKRSFPVIMAGCLVAGIIMTVFSYGLGMML
ncbi:MAG: COG2426 family protein [Acutalibacteraceae bacterium]